MSFPRKYLRTCIGLSTSLLSSIIQKHCVLTCGPRPRPTPRAHGHHVAVAPAGGTAFHHSWCLPGGGCMQLPRQSHRADGCDNFFWLLSQQRTPRSHMPFGLVMELELMFPSNAIAATADASSAAIAARAITFTAISATSVALTVVVADDLTTTALDRRRCCPRSEHAMLRSHRCRSQELHPCCSPDCLLSLRHG